MEYNTYEVFHSSAEKALEVAIDSAYHFRVEYRLNVWKI